MATVSLRQRIDLVTTGARRLLRRQAIGWYVTLACVVTFLAGSGDYLLRFHDVGMRYIWSALWWGALIWGWVRWVFPALRYRCTELSAARRIGWKNMFGRGAWNRSWTRR